MTGVSIDNTREATCDWCEERYPKSDEVTVEWANVGFCSPECRSKWGNTQRVTDLDLP